MTALERLFARLFGEMLPSLPSAAKAWVARLLPWGLLLLGALGFVAWLAGIGLFGSGGSWAAGYHRSMSSLLLYLLVPLLQIMAVIAGFLMLSGRRLGWCVAFYSLLLGLIFHLICLSVGGMLADLVFAYLLFQVRAYFRG